MTSQCPHCGNINRSTDAQCLKCGNYFSPQQTFSQASKPSKKARNWLIIIAVLLVIGGIGNLLDKNKRDNPTPRYSTESTTYSPTPYPSPSPTAYGLTSKPAQRPAQRTAPARTAPQPSERSGASALCRDGTLSYSQNRRGTCSHHGGVAQWY